MIYLMAYLYHDVHNKTGLAMGVTLGVTAVLQGQARCTASLGGGFWLRLIDCHPCGLPAGHQDRGVKRAAGLGTKLPVLWQWTGRYFEHCTQPGKKR